MDRGAFIMHRCHGCTTDIDPAGTLAVTKLKATITQRFVVVDDDAGGPEIELDVEADCRFCFFFEQVGGRWGARLVRHWYEKDKILPVDPSRPLPPGLVDQDKVRGLPPGYRYLAYFQERTMGVEVLKDMPGHRRHVGTENLEKHDFLYWQAKSWLEGKGLDIEWPRKDLS